MRNKILVCLLVSAFNFCTTKAQIKGIDWPKIGQKCPDIQFSNVQYHESNKLNIRELKGKWVVLDFWNRSCTSCIEEFPRLDSLQKEFDGNVKVILIGYTGSQYWSGRQKDNIFIQDLYEKVRKRNRLSLSIVFDSTAFHQLGVYSPLKVIIDPRGIVRGVTYRFTKEDMKSFLSGKEPKMPKSWFKNENKITYDPEIPFLMNGNGGNDTDYLYRSILSEYKDYMRGNNEFRYAIAENKLQVIGTDLASLYRFAYTGAGYINYGDSLYGKVALNPILEVKDQNNFKVDRDLRTGMYAYSISFPASKNSKVSVMKMVQGDLQNYFGFQAQVQTRKMAVLNLVLSEKIKPVSKLPEGVPSYPFESINNMLGSIATYLSKEGTFIDATGLKSNINITLNCKIDDLEDVKRALRENGFDLVKGEKEMQVLVIRDNPDEIN